MPATTPTPITRPSATSRPHLAAPPAKVSGLGGGAVVVSTGALVVAGASSICVEVSGSLVPVLSGSLEAVLVEVRIWESGVSDLDAFGFVVFE